MVIREVDRSGGHCFHWIILVGGQGNTRLFEIVCTTDPGVYHILLVEIAEVEAEARRGVGANSEEVK